MSRFVTGVADLVREECCMSILHYDVTLHRLIIYSQSIEGYKHGRIGRIFKRSVSNYQCQPRFKKKVSSKEESRVAKFNIEKGGGSQVRKPTSATCGNRHYDEFLMGTGSCF